MSTLGQDFRFAARTLKKRPLFFGVAVLTLALGIGANSLIFSVAESCLLRPLPYGEPDRLVTIWSQWVDKPKTWVSRDELALYRDGVQSFSDVAAFGQFMVTVGGDDAPAQVAAASVTANLLEVLGLAPAAGRSFAPEEASNDAGVVLVSHELWQRRFAGDPGLVGSAIDVEGSSQTVIGILPAGLALPQDLTRNRRSEIWFPMTEPAPFETLPPNGGSHGWLAIARLAPEASLAAARKELETHNQRWTEAGAYSEIWNFRTRIFPVQEEVTGRTAPALKLLSAAVLLLLLIACANLASLSLARILKRRREMAVRSALGAGRLQISRLVLAESFLIALGGGLLGLGLAAAGLPLLKAFAGDQIPRLGDAALNLRVLAFTSLVSVTAAILCGLFPALWAARRKSADGLGRGQGGNFSGRWGRGFTVASQVALAVVLLTGTGLMLRTVQGLLSIDPGFDREDIVVCDLGLPAAYYPENDDVTGFYREALEEIRQQPSVVAAGAIRLLPLAQRMGDWGIEVEGYSPDPGENPAAEWQSASAGYFEAMGIAVQEGRAFTAGDDGQAPPVMVINRSFAEAYWPGASPLGKKVRIGGRGGRPWTTVVGVVEDVVHNGLTASALPTWYLPVEQFHQSTGFASRDMSLIVRTRDSADAALGQIQATLREIDPRLAIHQPRSLEEVVGTSIATPRLAALLLSTFSGLAVLLAVVGIFGVTAAWVAERRREMGIRISLGARARQTAGLVVAQGSVSIGLGLLMGVFASLLTTSLLEGLLYGVGTLDPLTFILAPLSLAAAGLLASYLPARRAAQADPRTVLQEE